MNQTGPYSPPEKIDNPDSTGTIPANVVPVEEGISAAGGRPMNLASMIAVIAISIISSIIALLFNSAWISAAILAALFEFIYPWISSEIKVTTVDEIDKTGITYSLAGMGIDFFTPLVIIVSFYYGVQAGLLSIILLQLAKWFLGQEIDSPFAVLQKDLIHAIIAIVIPLLRGIGLELAGTIMMVTRFIIRIMQNVLAGNFGFIMNPKGLWIELLNIMVAVLIFRIFQ